MLTEHEQPIPATFHQSKALQATPSRVNHFQVVPVQRGLTKTFPEQLTGYPPTGTPCSPPHLGAAPPYVPTATASAPS